MSARQHWKHTVVGALVAVLALAGTLVTAEPAGAHGRSPGRIPATAFIQAEDLGGAEIMTPDATLRPFLRPALPCGARRYHSLGLRRAAGSISFMHHYAERPTVVIEHVALYRADGARRYLAELRRAMGRHGCTDRTGRWTVLRRDVAGRDSLLIRLRERTTGYEGRPIIKDTYLIVARVGRAVVTLSDIGWEESSGHAPVVRTLIPIALRRAAALR
jgi:hypothetical protein